MAIQFNSFDEMTSAEALFEAWFTFRTGKTDRPDVRKFERHLEKNVFKLHCALRTKYYRHGSYESFFVLDPKLRHIRKAQVRDRLVHQAVYTVISRMFEPTFIYDTYSSRVGKGTHLATNALRRMTWKVSQNLNRPCWALKCDIRKFYDSVDHETLLGILGKSIRDESAFWLLREIIESFHREGTQGKGLPIGNLTSQIFTNIYLNELDQFVKHDLKVKYYLRYADDFMLLSHEKNKLEQFLPAIGGFLREKLELDLHPQKVLLRPLHQGIDFLGYVTLPYHRILRTKTKRRMLRKLSNKFDLYFEGKVSGDSLNQSLQSYLGLLCHANSYALRQAIKNRLYWLENRT